MKFGMNVRNFGPSAGPAGLRSWAEFAENAGFSLLVLSDHIVLTPDVSEIYPAPFYDPFTACAWLSGLTTTLQLGTSVTVLPYRHPAQVARVSANIDQLSGGRFVLGVGVGWSRPEFEALGISFERRGPITDEYLAAITELLHNDTASFNGTDVAFENVATGPRPSNLPIWVGGSSAPAIRRAVQYADTWHPINADLQWLRDKGIPALHAAAAAADRPVPLLSPRMQIRLTSSPAGPERAPGTGTLDQVLGDLAEFAELGSDYLILDTNPDDPHDSRPLTADWGILETVVKQFR